MGKITRTIRRTAVWGVTGAGIFSLGGCVAEVIDFTPGDKIVQDYQDDITTANEGVAYAEQRLDEIKLEIGEVCLNAVRPYARTLGHVSETDAVNDLLNDPKQPCGNNPTDIRYNISQYRLRSGGLAIRQDELENATLNLEEANDLRAKDAEDNALVEGLMVGGVLGVATGLAYSVYYERVRRPEVEALATRNRDKVTS